MHNHARQVVPARGAGRERRGGCDGCEGRDGGGEVGRLFAAGVGGGGVGGHVELEGIGEFGLELGGVGFGVGEALRGGAGGLG